MKKRVDSIKGLFGQTIHYVDGKRVGESWPGFFGGSQNHYDADGNYIGSSETGIIADKVHYDENHHRIGESYIGMFGTYEHYDENGEHIGETRDSLFGTASFMDEDAFGFDSPEPSDFDFDP